MRLGQLDRAEEAVAVYTDLAARYGDDPALREIVQQAREIVQQVRAQL